MRVKPQRPGTRHAVGDGLKVHRRTMRLDRRDHTVISLRPGTAIRFSTNRFHNTWHVLSDDRGAQLLARLLWGLSYQARPGTLVVIDQPFLAPTPFDADPADPIVLLPNWFGNLTATAARELRHRLPLRGPSEGTVRWRSFGLSQDYWAGRPDWRWRAERGTTSRRSGMIVLAPIDPDECRDWAVDVARMNTAERTSDHRYLGPWRHGYDGEVQIFRHFHQMVGVAARARRQVLDRPDGPPADPEGLRYAIWAESARIRGQHLRIRGRARYWTDLNEAAGLMLGPAGINFVSELQEVGAVEAYRRMRAAQVRGLDLRMLWAMDAVITGIDRAAVSPMRRRQLLTQLRALDRRESAG
ncbi:TfoX/Sxy family DNA transformation protein [Nocardia arthritidis]|uniref:TfoX C-terminal domain-containing protein n=1 Tax=Nocardia arthritidis TaxID=228602 RepID=A0A6G9YGT8_9NOCA|nr:TfoX/Sxy family DNA transformation protein [Nocardia arthritidis]QIS12183.1 hypothetical protein F5544_21600 [Nocardia arthritidis]